MTSKFVPKRDGPYLIHKKVSPTTYLLAYPETPDKPIGKYHISDLKRYHAREDACSNVPEPVIPKRRRVQQHDTITTVWSCLATATSSSVFGFFNLVAGGGLDRIYLFSSDRETFKQLKENGKEKGTYLGRSGLVSLTAGAPSFFLRFGPMF
ncbi:hypothetical protein EVAR_27309_1 [Eumeta japonica]|uniref:Uncharacterized protein n=1 Tax=Eumeta variegata TaxID=151549 RepID=A0A4C1UDQ7_EUMVA|nr:hypothetical protein EVAR_27309_1 [Eumeta japonica]